jgi:2-polyprenyl-3-methyl-5-hydroxy-6-metoxy-1,4-benzoquinol methylase
VDVGERLSLAEIGDGPLLETHLVHRYELAASLVTGLRVLDLCCGSGYGSCILARIATTVHGVDISESAIEEARANSGRASNVSFEAGDVLAYLSEDLTDRFDAIICLDGLEQLPNTQLVLEELRGLSRSGMKMFLSLPNDGFEKERDPYHLLRFDHEAAMDAFGGLDGRVLLYQYLAEGSLIASESPESTEALLVHPSRAEPEYANSFVAAVGFDNAAFTMASARMSVAVSPTYSSYVRSLERANDELYAANARLMHGHLSSSDGAATASLARLSVALSDVRSLQEANRALWSTNERLGRLLWELQHQLESELPAMSALRKGETAASGQINSLEAAAARVPELESEVVRLRSELEEACAHAAEGWAHWKALRERKVVRIGLAIARLRRLPRRGRAPGRSV